ncbi:MAG TPA: hypothetical protein P5295_06380 [Spirochaetota bacterium]|nr:hypothetical protein [Spirochaetota bacterium]
MVQNDNRENLRRAIFSVIEQLTKHPLSERGKDLVINYFNDSREKTSFMKALDAIEKYFPESMPPEDERPPKLQKRLDALRHEAAIWDGE